MAEFGVDRGAGEGVGNFSTEAGAGCFGGGLGHCIRLSFAMRAVWVFKDMQFIKIRKAGK